MTIAPEAGDVVIYTDPEQQCITDQQSPINSFEMTAVEETSTTVATRTITPETGDLYSSPRKQRIQDHGLEANAAEKTRPAAQLMDSICCIYGHSDHSDHSDHCDPTIGACSSGGEGVCSECSLTKSDSTVSCSTTRIPPISIQQQMEELHATVSCPYVDSADNLINLPDDLIKEVLSRLSMTDIVRLGYLNRSWHSELPRILNYDGLIFTHLSPSSISEQLAYLVLCHPIYPRSSSYN